MVTPGAGASAAFPPPAMGQAKAWFCRLRISAVGGAQRERASFEPDVRKVVSMLEERLAWCSVRACLP